MKTLKLFGGINMRKLLVLALTLGLVMGVASMASASKVTVGYYEDFSSYYSFGQLWAQRSNPIYYGFIGDHTVDGWWDTEHHGTFDWGGKYVWVDDDAGIFLNVSTLGYENVSFKFRWYTDNAWRDDWAEFGVYYGDLSEYFNDGFSNTNLRSLFEGANGNIEKLGLSKDSNWVYESFSLASNTEDIWIYLAINDGEGTKAFFDNLAICGTEMPPSQVPIPGAVWLLGSGLVGLAGLKRKYLG